jgi:hypothetical protein
MLRQAASRQFRGPAALILWASWVLGPVAWALHENVSYFLVPQLCGTGQLWPLHLASVLTLALAAAGAAIAWRSWTLAEEKGSAAAIARGRIRFMALVGLLFSGLSAFGILVESIPNFILDPCLDAS